MNFGDGGRTGKMMRAANMNKGAGKASTANKGGAAASVSVRGRLDRGDRPRVGQIVQRALEQETEREGGNGGGETWEQACIAQRMTPQRSPFQSGEAGSGVVVHGPLLRRQTPYPRFVVTTGAQAAR